MALNGINEVSNEALSSYFLWAGSLERPPLVNKGLITIIMVPIISDCSLKLVEPENGKDWLSSTCSIVQVFDLQNRNVKLFIQIVQIRN